MSCFRDREDAARRLIRDLPAEIDAGWLVLALPRGGTPLAAAIARHLGAELDLLVVRKVGFPGYPDLAVAAVTGPGEDQFLANDELQRAAYLNHASVRQLAAQEASSIEERRASWTGARAPVPLEGRDVLLVDDGAATGTTLGAAVQAARREGARRIAVAVPVALAGALRHVEDAVDYLVCPFRDLDLRAVSLAYDSFPQLTDREMTRLLSARPAGAPEEPPARD